MILQARCEEKELALNSRNLHRRVRFRARKTRFPSALSSYNSTHEPGPWCRHGQSPRASTPLPEWSQVLAWMHKARMEDDKGSAIKHWLRPQPRIVNACMPIVLAVKQRFTPCCSPPPPGPPATHTIHLSFPLVSSLSLSLSLSLNLSFLLCSMFKWENHNHHSHSCWNSGLPVKESGLFIVRIGPGSD